MKKVSLEIIIPIYNEGKSILKLFELFQTFVKTEFRILLCYDKEDDDVFSFYLPAFWGNLHFVGRYQAAGALDVLHVVLAQQESHAPGVASHNFPAAFHGHHIICLKIIEAQPEFFSTVKV